MKKILAALTVPGLLLGGAVAVGAQTTDDAVADDTVTEDNVTEDVGARERHRQGRHHGGQKFAEALDMTTEELRVALQDGQTIAEIASAQGVDIDAVISDLVAEAQAMADENPGAPRAQNFDADELTEKLTAAVNGEFTPGDGERGERHGRRGFPGGGAIAEALGLEPAEVRAAVESGSTIADIAADQGVDISVVIDQIVADAQTRADENPDSPRAQNFDADEFEERLTDRVNREFEPGERPERGDRGDRGHRGPRGPRAGVGADA